MKYLLDIYNANFVAWKHIGTANFDVLVDVMREDQAV